MDESNETHLRSIAKGLSWRIFASISTMAIVYYFTRDVRLTVGVGAFEFIAKLMFYYVHERAWVRVAWGKKKVEKTNS